MDRSVDIHKIYEIFRSLFPVKGAREGVKADSKSEKRNSIVQREVRVLF